MSTNDAIQTVTDEEMREFGFDPECPMISQRLPGWPVKLRHNDDLVERYESGGISVWMGFFTESQIAYRRIMGRIMCEKFETGTLQARIEMEREVFEQEFRPTEADLYLHALANEYHKRTEAYDRTVCTGPIIEGSIRPADPHEMAKINRHANRVRKELEEWAARDHGLSPEAVRKAICRYE